ncbi:MAG: glycosyltransferase family 4 protein [Flavobacteriaceae bacterium]|nr:glycosyltransferase family 4 protein [Flavobacteriaceae bacterium]
MKRKNKVYIDVFYYKTALSGLKTYIEELVKASKNNGSHEIEYIISHDINKLKNKHFFINSKFRIIRWIFQFRYLLWKQIILPFKLLINKVDILICPDYVAPIFCHSKKIVVIHDNFFWKYPKNYPWIWRNYYTKLIQLGLDSKTTIVTTSNYSKKGLESLFKKIKIYPIYQTSESFSIQQTNKNEKKYILHVGTFEKRKNLLTLVKAFKKLKDELKVEYKLVLAGSTYINGDNNVLLKIQKYIAEHNLFSSILMPGYIDKNKALYFYSNSLMYVFPSIDEGFGIPLLEALKLRVPVICSDIPIFREIADDSVLYFEKQNEYNLFERMKELIQSEELSNKLVSKGFERVQKFNRNNFIKEFEKIYK